MGGKEKQTTVINYDLIYNVLQTTEGETCPLQFGQYYFFILNVPNTGLKT